VLADGKKVDSIRTHHRKLIGLDMETYGVYHSAKNFSFSGATIGISIKSISDFADEVKNDKYRQYAAFTSANFIYELIRNKL
jgi:nucleoside phosphorylase